MRRLLSAGLAAMFLLLALLFSHCSDSTGPEDCGSPTVSIVVPSQDTVVSIGAELDLRADGRDDCGPLPGESVFWVDGGNTVGYGTTVHVTFPEAGLHAYGVTVQNSEGKIVNAQRVVTVNSPPTVEMWSPPRDTTLTLGQSLTLQAVYVDVEDALAGIPVTLNWSCSLDGDLGIGSQLTIEPGHVGTHVITLTATDSHGASASVSRTLTVVTPDQRPTARITAPTDGAAFTQGDTITFEGEGTDPEDGELTGASLIWESSLDDALGIGVLVRRWNLSVGTHVIRLIAMDSKVNLDTATITITVVEPPAPPPNQDPVATIEAPDDSTRVAVGDTVTFIGTGEDPEDGDLSGTDLIWVSSVDGYLATGSPFQTDSLSAGAHRIRLDVWDSDGAMDSAAIMLFVEAPGRPYAVISSPASGAVISVGLPITFSGSAADPEDGNLTGTSLAWASSLDGTLGIGTTFTRSDLSPGLHELRLIATDTDGMADTASQALRLNRPPMVTILRPGQDTVIWTDTITLIGAATDPDGDPLVGNYVWVDTVGGATILGFGEELTTLTATLPPGHHLILFSKSDPYTLAVDSVQIDVEEPPLAPLEFVAQPADVPPPDNVFADSFRIYPPIRVGGPNDWSGSVALSLGVNPCGGALSGQTEAPVLGGEAVFDSLVVTGVCDGYTLVASGPDVESATSRPFNVTTAGDVNADGRVDQIDLYRVTEVAWNATDYPPEDINKDGAVNVVDLALVLSNWTGGAAINTEPASAVGSASAT